MPRYPKGAVIPTGTGMPHITSGVQDAAAKLIENADVASNAAIISTKLSGVKELINQSHPTLQVLGTMDEATYVGIEKSGNNYQIFSAEESQDFTTFTEIDPGTKITITATKVDVASESSNVSRVYKSITSMNDFTINMEIYCTQASESWYNAGFTGLADAITQYSDAGFDGVGFLRISDNNINLKVAKVVNGALTLGTAISIGVNTLRYITLSRKGTTLTLSVFSDSGRTTHITGSPKTLTVVNDNYNIFHVLNTDVTSNNVASYYIQNAVNKSLLLADIVSAAISSDAAVLSFFKHLKANVSNGTSSHATPVQAEIYGDADSYAAPLNATTKFTIDPTDPRIILKRDALDTITASSGSQTVWNMTVAGGMAALPNHGSILAQEIGVASVLVVEKSILGNFSDTVVLTEETDYIVDYSTRTATKITLTSGTGIVNAQSKLRLSWIADVMKVGATHNTALKLKIHLNRTNVTETSPDIEPISLGTAKYAELLYGT